MGFTAMKAPCWGGADDQGPARRLSPRNLRRRSSPRIERGERPPRERKLAASNEGSATRVATDVYRFDSFELHAVDRRLVVGGAPVAIGARAFDVLLALAEREGRPVPKRELLDAAWPGLVVEENNLQVQIATLRKLLGAQSISTIPGRGYRLARARREAASGAAGPA